MIYIERLGVRAGQVGTGAGGKTMGDGGGDGGRRVVELLARHEEAIAELYEVYERLFSSHAELWRKLSEEEREHAEWIRRIDARISDGQGCIRVELFDAGALELSLREVERARRAAEAGECGSVSEALERARLLEESIFESRYFEVFEGNCAEIRQVQYCLREAAKTHRERLELSGGS